MRTADIQEVGPYRVLAELGRGGMGRVLLGSGPDGRLVAVKLVHEQFAQDEGFRARFRREVAASRAVSGAYTAAIVDADPDAPTPWLASVFVPGPSLHDTLTTVGPLPETAVLRLVAGLATALTHIHRAGLVHRDLKPANVLLTDDGPRVIDFGIVRAISDGRHDELTQTGWLVGSPAFMSPEQADGATVTAASDVFSLGSVVVAAATGASPFTGAATLHTLNNVLSLHPDLADVPETIRRLVTPCLAKDPADRPKPEELLASIGQLAPSARPWPEPVHQLITRRQTEIAEFLEPGQDATVLLTERPLTSTLVKPPAPRQATLLAKPPARRLLLLVAAAVVVLALVGAVVWATRPGTGQGAGSSTASSTAPSTTTSPAAPPLEQTGEIVGGSPVTGLAFSPDGSVLTTRFDDETLQSWNVADRTQVGQIIGAFNGSGVGNPVISADGRTLIALRMENDQAIVEKWDIATGRSSRRPFATAIAEDDILEGPLLSPDGRALAVTLGGYDDPVTHVWDIASGAPIGTVGGYVKGFSRDSGTLFTNETIDDLCQVSTWDVATRQLAGAPFHLPESEYLKGANLSEDGAVLVTVSDNGSLRWWDTTSRNQIRQPVHFAGLDIAAVMFSPDGAHLVTRSNGDLQVWEVNTGEKVGATMYDVTAMAFAPDGTLATGGEDNTARLWRLPA